MSGTEFFGLAAVIAMVTTYALERRSHWFVAAFALEENDLFVSEERRDIAHDEFLFPGGRLGKDGESRAGADRDVRARNADQIDHQRNGENRTATADEPEREADQAARSHAQKPLCEM